MLNTTLQSERFTLLLYDLFHYSTSLCDNIEEKRQLDYAVSGQSGHCYRKLTSATFSCWSMVNYIRQGQPCVDMLVSGEQLTSDTMNVLATRFSDRLVSIKKQRSGLMAS